MSSAVLLLVLAASLGSCVQLARPVTGRETLLSIEKARAELGYAPQHSWLDEV